MPRHWTYVPRSGIYKRNKGTRFPRKSLSMPTLSRDNISGLDAVSGGAYLVLESDEHIYSDAVCHRRTRTAQRSNRLRNICNPTCSHAATAWRHPIYETVNCELKIPLTFYFNDIKLTIHFYSVQ